MGDTDGAPKGRRTRRPATRTVLAVLAACAIAFCAWSMSQYAQGKDPLAPITGSGALSTTDTTATATAATETATSVTTVTEQDVSDAIAALAFDGQDVSVPASQAKVVLSNGGIWVEQATGDDDATMVAKTARRADALAAWAEGTRTSISQVTWIAEDERGTVRASMRFSAGATLPSGSTADLLGVASAYRISGDAYAGLGEAPGLDQQKGDVPTLPDGSAIAVAPDVTASGETLVPSGSATTYSWLTSPGSSTSTSTSTSTSDGRSPTVTVSVVVDGTSAGGGSGSARLALRSGSTVYDALVASGADVNARATAYGMYVASIDGLAEGDHGARSGWTYSVNGVEPSAACSSYVLGDGDAIVWTYVNVEY